MEVCNLSIWSAFKAAIFTTMLLSVEQVLKPYVLEGPVHIAALLLLDSYWFHMIRLLQASTH